MWNVSYHRTYPDYFVDHYLEAIFNLKNKAYPTDGVDYLALRILKPEVIGRKDKKVKSIKDIGVRNYSTINTLASKYTLNNKIGVLDIETVLLGNKHHPYAIGYRLEGGKANYTISQIMVVV